MEEFAMIKKPPSRLPGKGVLYFLKLQNN